MRPRISISSAGVVSTSRADSAGSTRTSSPPWLLAASPWLFGFADESANVWLPHVIVGAAAIFLGLTTVQQGYSYRRSATTTASG